MNPIRMPSSFRKRFALVALPVVLTFAMSGCLGSGDDPDPNPAAPAVPRLIFGANTAWEHLGDGAVEGGDLLRDRSFRSLGDADLTDYWLDFKTDGKVEWKTTEQGDTAPTGGKYYTGYAEITGYAGQYTGIVQGLMSAIYSGKEYTLTFSSYGIGGSPDIKVFLYDDFAMGSFVASGSVTAIDGSWSRHTVKLIPDKDAADAVIGVYVYGGVNAKIDEVRLSEAGAEPSVKSSFKDRVRDLGITSLRWPGGTLADEFHWEEAVGSRIGRGEVKAYDRLETPAFGLHEFLDLCEELGLEPLIIVNVLDTPASAEDLVEYILGPASSVQGALRTANGRTSPWNATFFEIGNEPTQAYQGGSVPDAGAHYAALAKPIISAMRSKAAELGKTIRLGGSCEPNFQLADWVIPDSANDIVKLIYNWNAQVFDAASGIGSVDFVHGHFYPYRDFHTDEEERYRRVMSGGAVLSRTIAEKLLPRLGALPLWITEYNVILEKTEEIQAAYTLDTQSGLAVADLLMSIIGNGGIEGAHVWCLAQKGAFGIMSMPETWNLKPAGLVFRLMSPMAGEEILEASIDDTDVYAIASGVGNIPSGLEYPLVSVLATRNAATGKPRIFLLNRDYASARTVTVYVDGLDAGEATVYRYGSGALAAHNEIAPETVTVESDGASISSPMTITLSPHSLVRVDAE